MKALIFKNKVVDVKETEFEVHSSMTWVECDDTVKIGFAYDGTNFTDPSIPSAEQIEAIEEQNVIEAKKLSGNNKLLALGLTQEEATLLTGYKPTA
jgi:hypothetical protein|tara:strand:+ start:867 stop:1154 length:288 start_codon:yes stop_codon:yes gene_type:complete